MLDLDLWNRVWDLNKFRALCVCGTRLTSARRLLHLGFGFWGVTDLVAYRFGCVMKRDSKLFSSSPLLPLRKSFPILDAFVL
ncbi:hypothetical protein SLEP1_g17215 [Rubroshorea leprosula]|uniref:Uncharacterized protein n=1 Tax=Rubroshorea leprosula TaxID=152421 RepID=A0AAV5J2D8_9ROSI|nr:hypothetical protein SLEP1_g17215 [Rubroshorea leprosula]